MPWRFCPFWGSMLLKIDTTYPLLSRRWRRLRSLSRRSRSYRKTRETLPSSDFSGTAWHRESSYPGPTREKGPAQRTLSGCPSCSFSGLPVRYRFGAIGCLPPQVGSGDDPGQDAQPRLHPLPLLGRVIRVRSFWRLPAGGPGFPDVPAGPRRFVSSGVVSHILSCGVRDWASMSSWGAGFRIISFTFHWSGSSVRVFGSVIECAPQRRRKEPPIGAALARVPAGPLLFRLTIAPPAGSRRDADRLPAVATAFGVQRPVCGLGEPGVIPRKGLH